VGFSDFTALALAAWAQAQVPTWAGPALIEDFGQEDEPDDITVACWDDVISGAGEGTGWRIGKGDPSEFILRDVLLWGGNLAVLTSLVGTPYLPSDERGILFLEDVGEQPYRVERMLTQLLHSGVLARQKAVLLGAFTGQRKSVQDKGYSMASTVAWLRAHCEAKVLTGLPFGHVRTKVTLPVGRRVELAVQGREALLVWGHQD
jgi:muramoyltetrapeptide carboxypeptidase